MTSDEFDDRSKARSGYKVEADGPRKIVTMQVFRGTEKLGELRLVADQETADITLGSTEPKRKK